MAQKKSWLTEEERKRMRWVLPMIAVGVLVMLYAIGLKLHWWS